MFAQQRFASALDRYKSAVASAPDMAAAYFREGHAFVATHQFDLAAKAFKLGVLLSKDIPADTIALDELYGDNLLTKQSRMEAVAQSALLDQQNADLLFLVGILLHQDGQVERAKTFFDHAAQREGSDAEYLRPFLAKPTASSLDGLTDV